MRQRHENTFEHVLGSCVRARILRIMLMPRQGRPWVRDLCRRAQAGPASVRRELEFLTEIGLVRMRREAGAAYYELQESHPFVFPLRFLLEASDELDLTGGTWSPGPVR